MGTQTPDFDLDDDWEPESWEDELEELDDESWQDYDPLDDQRFPVTPEGGPGARPIFCVARGAALGENGAGWLE